MSTVDPVLWIRGDAPAFVYLLHKMGPEVKDCETMQSSICTLVLLNWSIVLSELHAMIV